ncbi:type II toxin-antitoxin system VapC family toxin [Aliarcobacter cryaerophilus]|uniref:type II toxin-antitoxin system VapC family toxin n=1 Tax=Aliarcobacter cryaerophilus TaxID=28198 RepID=UPI0021B4EF68|nr:type II toxin-antitoxin system VapC family toxin [Aliarcobacter cryaerophilus]MCT7486746.1 type II toxin-antitoxin system VapC family toxin [Aliarcobacter cryaerophilus]MCT7490811.1 type II toxin-antitoxin system VapC family toxin [Aliarcobacter cryaerophilus]
MIYDYLLDTDVLIWYLRGNKNSYNLIHSLDKFCISSVTYMELVQGMRNKDELRALQKTLKQWEVKTIYINEEISARALFYMEEYFLSHSMQLADSLIASTAITYGMKLITANDKHYKILKDIDLQIFRP